MLCHAVFLQDADCLIGHHAVSQCGTQTLGKFLFCTNAFPGLCRDCPVLIGFLFFFDLPKKALRNFCQDLHAVIAVLRMGVSNAAGHFDQLADVAHKKHFCKSGIRCHLHRVVNEVGGRHRSIQGKAVFFEEKVLSVITRRRGKDLQSLLLPHPDLHPDGIQQSLVTHGLDNSAGAQDRDPALDPEFWVEGLGRQLPPLRDRDGYIKPPRDMRNVLSMLFGLAACKICRICFLYIAFRLKGFQDLLNRLSNHPSRCTVDGCISNRLIQPGFCHTADSLASVNADARYVRTGSSGIDQGVIGNIRVISAVLLNGAGNCIRISIRTGVLLMQKADVLDLQDQVQPFRGFQLHLRNPLPCHKHQGRRLCRCGCAASRRISQAEPLSALFDVLIKFHCLPCKPPDQQFS